MAMIKNLIKENSIVDKKDDKEKGKKPPIVVQSIKSATDLQRFKLEKLMKNPDKPVEIPEYKKDFDYMKTVPDFVRNVMGSSAGAGSGEFHVYRHLRRKEYSRQKYIEAKSMREKRDEDFQNKLEQNRELAAERTAKKRAKRQKKKKNKSRRKNNATIAKPEGHAETTDDDDDDDDAEDVEADANKDENEDKCATEPKVYEMLPANREETSEQSVNDDNDDNDNKDVTCKEEKLEVEAEQSENDDKTNKEQVEAEQTENEEMLPANREETSEKSENDKDVASRDETPEVVAEQSENNDKKNKEQVEP